MEGSGESNTIITGSLDSSANGVVRGANATLSRLTVKNIGTGKQNAVAVSVNSSSTRFVEVTASANNAANNYGLYSTGTGTISVLRSTLAGSTNTVLLENGTNAQMTGSSFLGGPVVNNGSGEVSCAASTDAVNAFYSNTCPPYWSLEVIDTQPRDGWLMPANGILKVQFNHAMNPATINSTTFKVYDGDTGAPIDGNISYDSANRAAVFTFPGHLVGGVIGMTINTGVRDSLGGRLSADFTMTTWVDGQPDNTPPGVASTNPASGGIDAPLDGAIVISFDEVLDTITLPGASITLTDQANNPIAVRLATSFTGNTDVLITPVTPLIKGSPYTVTVSNVKDYAGNTMTAPYSFTFNTMPIAAPSNLIVQRGSLQATLNWWPVTGATSYNLYWSNRPGVTRENGTQITNATYPYIHTVPVDNMVYYYVVAAVKDNVEGPISNEAAVLIDGVPPTVTSTHPAANATDIALGNDEIDITFSETIDGATFNISNVVVTDSAGATVTLKSFHNGWFRVSYIPEMRYTVTINGIKDLQGNVMTEPYAWSFTTGALGIPTVTATAGSSGSNTITLNWSNATNAATYNVYWSTSPGVSIDNGTKIVNPLRPVVLSGLEAGTTYYYIVTAVRNSVEGPPSAEVSAVAP